MGEGFWSIDISDVFSVLGWIVAIWAVIVANKQLRANDSPRMTISNTFKLIRHDRNNNMRVIIKNLGKGICLDAILLVKIGRAHV